MGDFPFSIGTTRSTGGCGLPVKPCVHDSQRHVPVYFRVSGGVENRLNTGSDLGVPAGLLPYQIRFPFSRGFSDGGQYITKCEKSLADVRRRRRKAKWKQRGGNSRCTAAIFAAGIRPVPTAPIAPKRDALHGYCHQQFNNLWAPCYEPCQPVTGIQIVPCVSRVALMRPQHRTRGKRLKHVAALHRRSKAQIQYVFFFVVKPRVETLRTFRRLGQQCHWTFVDLQPLGPHWETRRSTTDVPWPRQAGPKADRRAGQSPSWVSPSWSCVARPACSADRK